MSNPVISQVAISTIKGNDKQDIYPKTTDKAVITTDEVGNDTTLDKAIEAIRNNQRKDFVVTLTISGDDIVADKSYQQIDEAWRNGEGVYLKPTADSNVRIPLINKSSNYCLFQLDNSSNENTHMLKGYELRYLNGEDTWEKRKDFIIQELLVSGTSIKTVNSTSLLGEGNVSIPAGKSAYQSYLDITTDNPPMTETEWIQSLHGEDGVDLGEVALVDNLLEGGRTSALSAEQGKILGQAAFTNAYVAIDTSALTRQNCSPGPDKKWTSGQNSKPAKHIAVPVTPGHTYSIAIKMSTSTGGFYGWLTSSYSPPYSDLDATPYVGSSDRVRLSTSSGATTQIAPDNAAYLVLGVIDGSMAETSWNVSEIIKKTAIEAVNDEVEDIRQEVFGAEDAVTITSINGWVEADLQATHLTDNKRTCVRVPVSEGDVLTVTAQGSGNTSAVFLSAASPVDGYWQCLKEDNTAATSRFSVVLGRTKTFTAPASALYFMAVATATDAAANYTPIIKVNKQPSLSERIEELEGKSLSEKNIHEYGAKGDGTTNDTTAIQQAFNAGGGIYFPAGTYIINNYIDVYSHTHVRMDSQAVIKRAGSSSQKCLLRTWFESTTTEYNGISDFTLEGGVLDMNISNTNAGACVGLMHAKNIVFKNVTFQNARNEYHLVDMGACNNVKYIDCIFQNSNTNTSNAEQIQIDFADRTGHPYLQYDAGSACYDHAPCKNIEIKGCTFYLNGYSPAVGNHNYGAHKDIDIHDNVVYGAGKSVTTFNRGAFAFADAYSGSGGNHTTCMIHHNHVNDCRYIISTMDSGSCNIYLRDNVFRNFNSVKSSNSHSGINLLNNIELND